jgi:molybdopterin-guanine dinucleotide biosynthesis protein A
VSAAPRLLGAVLAGGESRRLGRDKAHEPVAGVRLVERAARTLGGVVEDVVVVSARPIETDRPRIADLRPPCGPLGGIEAALTEAVRRGLDGVVVLACDLPLVTAGTVRALVEAFADSEVDVAAAVATRGASEPSSRASRPDAQPEPLCAAYGIGCLPCATTLLDARERAVHRLLASVRVVPVERPAAELLNVNTEAELARAEAAMAMAIARR